MPFLGQDWRSPGEQWVKTHKGCWERLKLLDNTSNFNEFQFNCESSSGNESSDSETSLNLMDSENIQNHQNLDQQKDIPDKFYSDVINENSNFNSNKLVQNNKIYNNLNCQTDLTNHFNKRITNLNNLENDQFTITELNNKMNKTENTSIQNIILKLEKQHSETFNNLNKIKNLKKPFLDKQCSFDNSKIMQKLTKADKFLKLKKKIDQPMDLINENTIKETVLKENIKIINKENSIKQFIKKIDLNSTQKNIKKHLEDDFLIKNSKEPLKVVKKYSSFDLNYQVNPQPYFPITLKITKEVANYNTISDAFLKLDFYNAIKDIRRFNYISKLLHLLITQNLTSLSGRATVFLFTLLEEIAFQVAGNQQNIHILHTLLYDVKKIMTKYYCWGRPLGSTLLWEQHLKTIEKICFIINNIEIKSDSKETKSLSNLPAELIRTILLQLSDYKDLINTGQVNDTMKSFLDEQHIWRNLCKYHFTNKQIKQFLNQNDHQLNNLYLDKEIDENIKKQNADNYNWEKIFHCLRKKFGLKEEFADSLFLCRNCRCLFWNTIGHPCLKSQILEEENKENLSSNNLSPMISRPRPMNLLINNQIDLNRQINNLNRVNNNFNDRPQVVENDENRFSSSEIPDSIPISPESFLKFFSL